jgi:hypothetical protein
MKGSHGTLAIASSIAEHICRRAYLWNRWRFPLPLLCRNFGLRYVKPQFGTTPQAKKRDGGVYLEIMADLLIWNKRSAGTASAPESSVGHWTFRRSTAP